MKVFRKRRKMNMKTGEEGKEGKILRRKVKTGEEWKGKDTDDE